MLSAIMSFLGIIPGLTKFFSFAIGKMFDAQVAIKTAQIGGDVAVATSMVTAEVQAASVRNQTLSTIAGSKVLSFLLVGFSLPWMIDEWKVVVWDTVLKWGTTSPINGEVGSWGHTIIICLFGSATSLTVGHMYFNRKQ